MNIKKVLQKQKIIRNLIESINRSDENIETDVKQNFEENNKNKKWEKFVYTKEYYKAFEQAEEDYWQFLWDDEYYDDLFEAMRFYGEYEWKDSNELLRKLNKYEDNLDNILKDTLDYINRIKYRMIRVIFNEVED